MANQCFDQKQESLEPEQEPSDKNELFHWILTLAIAVIIALCVNRFVLVNAEITFRFYGEYDHDRRPCFR